VRLANAPADVRAELREALVECHLVKQGRDALDFVMIFTKSRAELTKEFPQMAKLMAPAGMLWVSWPKKSSGVATDLDENGIREIGLEAGLVDVIGGCEGMRRDGSVVRPEVFVRRVKDRK